jgi:hypothetical protein
VGAVILALFLVVPIVELALAIQVGRGSARCRRSCC